MAYHAVSVTTLLVSTLVILPACNAGNIKMSQSGICHAPDSAHYQRTTRFTAYASLQSCLDAGGRLPKNYIADKQDASPYYREDWPHWLDADSDCQDARAEVLIQQSQTQVSYSDHRQCAVSTGSWLDPYSGKHFSNDDDLDIDHIVPLKFAHERGGAHWSRSEKARFANDFDNLLAVDDGLNQAKGAKGPTQWLPPAQSYHCQYLARFNYVMSKYNLTYTAQEQAQIAQIQRRCV